MPTRSGREYLIAHKCQSCDRGYYSHKNFDYKCSGCWDFCMKNGIMTSTEFGDKCRAWAKDNTLDDDGQKFILGNRNISDQHLYNLLTSIFEHTGKYISAEVGLKLFKANPTIKRGHLVGGFVADWWKIKSRNDNPKKRWPGYIDCYYGFWSNSIESWPSINSASIPPKMPLGPKNYMMNKFRT